MNILDIIILVLIISWIGGFGLGVAGSLVHLLLVIALVVFIFRILGGRSGSSVV
jgi:hypothetical protein